MGTHKKYTSHRALREHSRHLCHSLRTAHHLPAHPDVFIFWSETTRYRGCRRERLPHHGASLGPRGLVNVLLLREYPHSGFFYLLCPCHGARTIHAERVAAARTYGHPWF